MIIMNINNSIEKSLKRAEIFLLKQVETENAGIKRCSKWHDIKKYPDMCLPATYNAVHALILLGAYSAIEEEVKKNIVNYIRSYQTETGAFRFRHMKSSEIWKGQSISHSWQYIDNHITNYSIGALKSLGASWKYPLSFIKSLEEPENLKKWLSERRMSDPWLEGNNIVNLASFFICELEGRDEQRLKQLVDILFEWHELRQDPKTGFWGTNETENPAGIIEGMAGAAHNFHLYFYYNRKISHYEKCIDFCLEFIQGNVKSACLDIDAVDILSNFIVYGYRAGEIKEHLSAFAQKLICFQNEDGGFADEKTNGVRRMDGWAGGYFEPQGLSNCFATWFRCAALAMISCVLEPEKADRYRFRNTIGIGYFNKDYLR